MLQISQIEKPRCSAMIDQMRLRLAMALPLDSQNVASSGFQSAIQRVFASLIDDFLSARLRRRRSPRVELATRATPGISSGQKQKPPSEARVERLPRAAALPVARRWAVGPAEAVPISLSPYQASCQVQAIQKSIAASVRWAKDRSR